MNRLDAMRLTHGALLAALAVGPVLGQDKAPPASASADGFLLQSESGDYRLLLRAYTHFDGRFYLADRPNAGTNAFLFRRVRPLLQGTLAGHFDFTIMPDFGGGTAVLQDAYLDVRYTPKLRVRVGKFKSPVGLEQLQLDTAISFVERALPTSLVGNRDVGVQIHGELGGGVLAYALGVFDGAPDGGSVDIDTNDAKDVAGRLFLSPFKSRKSKLRNLAFGIAGSAGRQAGALPVYRTGGQLIFFSYNTAVTADGTRSRLSPQLSFYSGRLGLLGEYVRSRAALRRSTSQAGSFVSQAWQATGTVALTDDEVSYGGLRPKRPFDPEKRQWGGLELALRVNGLQAADDVFNRGFADPARSARKAFAWAAGLNWHLNRHVKQVLDFERTTFTGGGAGADRPAENALLIRTQLSF